MNSQILQWVPLFPLLLILKQLVLVSSNPLWYQTCGTTYNCGTMTGIQYPFIGNNDPQYCGYPGLELNCNQDNTTTIQIMKMDYRVLGIDQTAQIMKIAREDVMESVCPRDLVNTTLDYELFNYASNYMNLTFIYGCPTSARLPGFVSCGSAGNNGVYVLPGAQGPGNCNASVVVPVLQMGSREFVNSTGLDEALRAGFEVRWILDRQACRDCTRSGGRCGYDYATNQTTCFCADPPYMADTCPGGNGAPRRSGT